MNEQIMGEDEQAKGYPVSNEEKKNAMFVNSVACIIAEGSEFMSKSLMYDFIRKEFEKIIMEK